MDDKTPQPVRTLVRSEARRDSVDPGVVTVAGRGAADGASRAAAEVVEALEPLGVQ